MLANPSINLPVKPRLLIADDSRIVRATLIKHIEGLFEFREALDGEQAWETLLIDPSIRVVITDLTMPKLDGYGLLHRIRNSKISRIRNLPVVVVSGSDEQAERDRAKAAGATDLITKGIGTAQLLSRLDVLSKLVSTQQEFERGLEKLVRTTEADAGLNPGSEAALQAQAEVQLETAIRLGKNFVILDVCIALKRQALEGNVVPPSVNVVNAVEQMLQRTVRQTDVLVKVGDAEFMLSTGSIDFDAGRNFAQRICRAIARANLAGDEQTCFIASCGLVSLGESGGEASAASRRFGALREVARRRAVLGLRHGVSGVVGKEEEGSLRQGGAGAADLVPQGVIDSAYTAGLPDLNTMLRWVKEGKQDLVLEHIGRLSIELKPLLDFMLEQTRR